MVLGLTVKENSNDDIFYGVMKKIALTYWLLFVLIRGLIDQSNGRCHSIEGRKNGWFLFPPTLYTSLQIKRHQIVTILLPCFCVLYSSDWLQSIFAFLLGQRRTVFDLFTSDRKVIDCWLSSLREQSPIKAFQRLFEVWKPPQLCLTW